MATDVVTTTSAPWDAQQPYLRQAFSEAQRLYGLGGPQAYPGSTVAPMGQSTLNALSGLEGMAQNNPYQNSANQYFQNVVGGNYLNSNPYLDAMYNNAAQSVTRNFNESVLPGVSARFGMSGRTGSGLFQNAVQGAYKGLGDSLSGMAANIYGNNYGQERQMQQNMAQYAPNLLASQSALQENALNAGQMRDQQAQNVLSDQVQQYQFNQNRPYQNLSSYLGNIGGSFGSSSQTATPQQSTPWWQYALGGAGLLSQLL